MTPGEAESARNELTRADEAFAEYELLVRAGRLQGAASRLYFAVFHAARAALAARGSYAKTHAGQIALFERAFGPAPILGRLFGLRARADYARERFDASLEELEAAAGESTLFISRCRQLVDEAVARGPDEPDPPPDL